MDPKEQGNTPGDEKIVEQTATEASASFLEGFNEAEETVTRSAPAEKTPEAKPAEVVPAKPAAAASPAPAPAAEASPIPGMTMAQFKDLLAEVPRLRADLATAHGKIGELNRTVQAGKAAAPAPAATPAAAAPAEDGAFDPASFNPADWAKLYPDFALYVDKMVEDRAKALVKADPGADQSETIAKIHMDMLSMWQPDWKSLVKSSDYGLWLATQPAATQTTAHNTENALELSQIIQSFKDAQKGSAQADTAAADTTQAQKSRLAAAVVPAGTATHAASAVPTAQEEFLAGFNSG